MKIKNVRETDMNYLTDEVIDKVSNSISSRFSMLGMMIITGLMVIGIIILITSNVFFVSNMNELFTIIKSSGGAIVVALFFVFVAIFCWILYIRNVIINPRVEILYLLKKEKPDINGSCDITCIFVDKNGRNYRKFDKKYEKGKYYKVIKSCDYILAILDVSDEGFENTDKMVVKNSYWMNFYSPMGNFENIFFLPIVYVVLLIGFLSFVGSLQGFNNGSSFIILFPFRLVCSLFFVLPLGLIIYDFMYKYKLKRGLVDKNNQDELENRFNIFMTMQVTMWIIIRVIVLIIFNGVFWYFLINAQGVKAKLMVVPFIIIAGIALIKQILSIIKR